MNMKVFNIDCDKFRVIDISKQIEPNKEKAARPFLAHRSDTLPDGKDTEIIHTHTHVGTHVETARHFFREGKAVSDFPLGTFMGRGCLFSVEDKSEDDLVMRKEYLSSRLDGLVRENDILICRNDAIGTESHLPHLEEKLPHFTAEAAEYFIGKNVKMVVIGAVKFGADIESGKEFEGKLHNADIPILESPANLHEISRDRFFVIALPYKASNLGSIWVRAIVIEER